MQVVLFVILNFVAVKENNNRMYMYRCKYQKWWMNYAVVLSDCRSLALSIWFCIFTNRNVYLQLIMPLPASPHLIMHSLTPTLVWKVQWEILANFRARGYVRPTAIRHESGVDIGYSFFSIMPFKAERWPKPQSKLHTANAFAAPDSVPQVYPCLRIFFVIRFD